MYRFEALSLGGVLWRFPLDMSGLGFDFGYGRLVLFVGGYGLNHLDLLEIGTPKYVTPCPRRIVTV